MEDRKEKIYAIVVTYNRRVLLEGCLESLLTQTISLDKIFVVDNDSKDGTSEMMEKNFHKSQIDYINIKAGILA